MMYLLRSLGTIGTIRVANEQRHDCMPSILELRPDEVKAYFLESSNYVNFDLPPYFDFTDILQATSAYIGNKGVHEYFRSTDLNGKSVKMNPKETEGVNYKLIGNKDGEFGWRPYEIIHPALYVELVNAITKPTSWALLKDRFTRYEQSGVRCESIPFKSEDEEKHKAHQVKLWWTNVEQASLKLSLKYKYVYDVDVSDCYGSIYTHSIGWAIHGKQKMKDNRNSTEYLGNKIDWAIRLTGQYKR